VALEAFLDDYFDEGMKELHIPGAALVLVKDGRIFLAKGFGAPVTIANLLTHTGGFDEQYLGISAPTEADVIPLADYLALRMPPRVLPPGDMISYSNHGMALAGYLVEAISGIPFPRYVEENILRPLGMEQSSFLLPAHLARGIAVGYEYRRGAYHPVPFDYLDQIAPSGSLNATASDIARFMIAHLQLGRFAGARILEEATAREMHRQHITHHPRLPGFAYGFYEHSENHLRALSHGGSLRGFSSLLVLLPEQDIGIFASCNRQEPKLLLKLVSRFLDRYCPAPEISSPPLVSGNFTDPIERFEGNYRSVRYTRRTAEKLAVLLSQFHVTAGEGGILSVRYPRDTEGPTRWVRVGPLLFQRLDGEAYLAFRKDNDRVTHMFLQAYGFPLALEKLSWYEGGRFQFGLLTFIFCFFLSACIRWPANFLIHFRRRHATPAPRPARWARPLAGVTGTLNLVFFLAIALAFLDLPWFRLEYGMPSWLGALFVIPLVTTGLTAALPVFTWLAWKRGYWSRKERIHYSFVSLAALLFVPFLFYWNLLGFRF
jgi:CubicO group peptidase (beta-lactamase class C family)